MTRVCAFGIVILVFAFVTESSSQIWGQPNRYSYPPRPGPQYPQNYYQPRRQSVYTPQNDFPNNFQIPPGVSVAEAEWVCKNSKTGDMMIVTSEDGPAPNNNGINNQNPFFTQQPPTTQPIPPPTQAPTTTTTEVINETGEDLIEIRLGNRKAPKDSRRA